MSVLTLRAALAEGAATLSSAGVEAARHDAEVLAAYSLGCERGELWRHLDDPVPVGLADLLARRARREPLQHITGTAHFRHNTLFVGPGVFIPRPETEMVVEHALALLTDLSLPAPVVVDLCAGSGAIALAIATEQPAAVVHAVEVSPEALPWLRRNLAGSGVAVHATDVADPLPDVMGQADLVVANPPYIPSAAVPRDLEVANFDPPLALYSGPDGLDHVRIIERSAAALLRSGGFVVVEHADQQGVSAPAVFAASSAWHDVLDHPDLTGRDRFLTARRSAI